MTDRLLEFKKIQEEAFELFEKNNEEYENLTKEFGSSSAILVMGEKLNHYIDSFNKQRIHICKSPSIRKDFIELQNLASMAIILYNENK